MQPLTPELKSALPPLIPRAVLFGNPEKANPQLSPDGGFLAYLAPSEGVLNVWVRTLGQSDDRVVTRDRKRTVRQFFWQGDSRHILYLQDQEGDENDHVFQTNLETKVTRDLTPFPGAKAGVMAADPQIPDTILVQINARDSRLFDVYRLNPANGALELDTENNGDVIGFLADNKMAVRAAQAATPDGGTEIRVRDDAQSPWRTLLKWGMEDAQGGVAGFSPDGDRLWVKSSVDANALRLLEVEIATGNQTVLLEDGRFDVGALLVNPRTYHLEGVLFNRERTEWTLLDPALQADFDELKRTRDGDFWIASRSLADDRWIVGYNLSDAPLTYYLYERESRTATKLFSDRPDLDAYTLAKMEPVTYTARDGMALHGYLTLPTGAERRNLPAVLFIHGGPWARDSWACNPYVQWLANRGYAVLQINFRGSTGYGKAYLNSGNREWAGAMHTDLLDGLQWIVGQGIADAKRVAIMGGSYGGYATLAALTYAPDAFACGVDLFGPSNLNTLLASVPPYWEPMLAVFKLRMGDGEEFLNTQSPLMKASAIKAPLLIAQGANDVRVRQAESDQIVEALRRDGKTVEYYVFPDEGHGFMRPENSLKFCAVTEAFLAKHLGGRAEPPGGDIMGDEAR